MIWIEGGGMMRCIGKAFEGLVHGINKKGMRGRSE